MSTDIQEERLQSCPCCGSDPSIMVSTTTGDVIIACSKKGCKMVEAKTVQDAAELWNAKDFRRGR